MERKGKIIEIVCVAEDWAIGKKNGLLFKLKNDMERFKQVTANAVVVCGLNTLRSFPGGQPLKGRTTIVLCPEGTELPENVIEYNDFEKLVHDLKVLSITTKVFIIGGGMLYKTMLPYTDEVFVTKVLATDPEAEVFFPNMDEQDDFVGDKMPWLSQEDCGYQTTFTIYSRKKETE